MIPTRDISDVIAHLINHHKKLVKSWFSCTITDWNSYGYHWVKFRASCLGLIVVLEEDNVAARL